MPKNEALILMHGVDSFGSWYQPVKHVLQSHFECLPYSYTDYVFRINHIGKLRVALEPLWLTIVSVLLLGVTIGALKEIGLPWILICVIGVILIAITFVAILRIGGIWWKF